jgi:hypothetical protein
MGLLGLIVNLQHIAFGRGTGSALRFFSGDTCGLKSAFRIFSFHSCQALLELILRTT